MIIWTDSRLIFSLIGHKQFKEAGKPIYTLGKTSEQIACKIIFSGICKAAADPQRRLPWGAGGA